MPCLRPTTRTDLPKGLTADTLEVITALLRRRATALSATETAEGLGLSRVTARRCLEHLHEVGVAVREPRYGVPGRPEMLYRIRA